MVPEPPPAELAPSCAEAGVLGVLPGIIGSHPGHRGHQADPRPRRPAHRPAPRLRRASSSRFREYKVRVDPTNEITYDEPRPHRGRRARRPLHAPPPPGAAARNSVAALVRLRAPAGEHDARPDAEADLRRSRSRRRPSGTDAPTGEAGRSAQDLDRSSGWSSASSPAGSSSRRSARSGTGCASRWPTPRRGFLAARPARGDRRHDDDRPGGWTDVLALLGAHVHRVAGGRLVLHRRARQVPARRGVAGASAGASWPAGAASNRRRAYASVGLSLATLYLGGHVRRRRPAAVQPGRRRRSSAPRCCCSCCSRSACSRSTRRCSSRSSPSSGG